MKLHFNKTIRRDYVHSEGGLTPKSDRQNLGKDPFPLGWFCSSLFSGASELSNHHIGKGSPIHRPGCLGVMLDHEKWSLARDGVGMGFGWGGEGSHALIGHGFQMAWLGHSL